MLGTMSEAEDVVQECYLRVRDVDPAAIEAPHAYLTTVVTRLCLDVLKSARVRRESYDGPWLPEPVYTQPDAAFADSIQMAFLVILETLAPEERAIFLLSEVFDYSHDEVAQIVGKSIDACRQALHRAKQRVAQRKPRFVPSREQHERMVASFVLACQRGDVATLGALLADDCVMTSDGGGKAKAAKKPVVGAASIARALVGFAKHAAPEATLQLVELNGEPGVVFRGASGSVDSAFVFELESDVKIRAIRIVRNPDKLLRM
jgi:RNA polymerase sigma-70 factor, ECF subfamily